MYFGQFPKVWFLKAFESRHLQKFIPLQESQIIDVIVIKKVRIANETPEVEALS